MANHHTGSVVAPPKIQIPKSFYLACGAAAAVGFLSFGVGLFAVDPARAWKAYLIGLFFFTIMAMSGPWLVACLNLTRGSWAITVRRIPGSFWAAFAPLGILGLIFAIGGVDHVYEWAHVEYHDALTIKKLALLNHPFFIASTIIGYGVIGGFGYVMSRNSYKQDETGDGKLYRRNLAIAGPFLILMSLGLTLLSVHYVMSLHPHWFSTMWTVNIWITGVQAGLALMCIIAVLLSRKGSLRPFINDNHIHDLGKLLFTATAFWAYIAFCQFLLMWYANLPEEAIFWNARMSWDDPWSHPWTIITIIMPFAKWVVPFFLLLPRATKRGKFLIPISIWVLVFSVYEVWWWIAPAPSPAVGGGTGHGSGVGEAVAHHGAPPLELPWLELLVWFGFAGVFAASIAWALSRWNIIPIKDPRLEESMHFHQ
jgi:hypothetical protein